MATRRTLAHGTSRTTRKASPRVSARTTAYSHRRSSLSMHTTRRAHSHHRTQQPSHLPILVGTIAALIALVLIVFVACSVLNGSEKNAGVPAGQQVTITIPEGSGAATIYSELSEAGVLSSQDEFYKELRAQGAEQNLKSGTYSFVTGEDVSDVVKQLVQGPNTTESRLVVAEGLTEARLASEVESSLGIPQDVFLAQAKASNYVNDYPFLSEAQDDSLEGFLYPKTYDFSGKEVNADVVIRAMLDQYQAEVVPLNLDGAATNISSAYGIELDGYDILTIASIIEREAVTDEDRPLVASVFYNRLRDSMPLQSDATMGYVTGGEVTADDLKQESPYNTYLNQGLPPTPICTPSMASIKAAMEPASTDYLYFLIIENGNYSNHTFSKTYEEHQAAIDKALADQAAQ